MLSRLSCMDRPRLFTPDRNSLLRPDGMTRRSLLGVGAAAVAAMAVPGCSRGRSDEPAPDGPGIFATGNKGGVYNQFGIDLSKLISEVTGVTLQPVVTGGSLDNLIKVSSQKADIGFCTSDTALAAYEATGVFASGKLKFSALARAYDNYVHVVVPMAFKGQELKALEGKVVSVGQQTSGTKIVADLILNTAGVTVTKRFLSLEDSVKALVAKAKDPNARGGIDALIWSGGVPTEPIGKLQDSIGFRLLDIGNVAQTIALKEFGGYVVSAIPPSAYKLASSVPTLAIPNYIVAKPNLSDSWAWWTVNTLFRRQNDLIAAHPEAGALDPRSAIATMPIPLHPAAERWYRENHI